MNSELPPVSGLCTRQRVVTDVFICIMCFPTACHCVATAVHAINLSCARSIRMVRARKLNIVDLPQGDVMPMQRDWHARGDCAYVCYDAHTNSIILASKLTSLAKILNENARNKYEIVKVSGLFSAAHNGSVAPYSGGLHKMRYGISRSNLTHAHNDAIEKARSMGASKVCLVTEVS